MTYTVWIHPAYTNPSMVAVGIEFNSLDEAQGYAKDELKKQTGREPEEESPTCFVDNEAKLWASIYDEFPF